MSEPTRREDLEGLGLSADVAHAQVARAYRELRDLYGEDSLATYSPCAPAERRALLDRIEEAHARLAGRSAVSGLPLEPRSPAASGPPAADPAESPGAFLRLCREARSLSLQDVADETRISSRHLEHIEEEAFGQLPVRVYLWGFLVAYARALRLDSPSKLDTQCAQAA